MGGLDSAKVLKSMELMSKHVIPYFRAEKKANSKGHRLTPPMPGRGADGVTDSLRGCVGAWPAESGGTWARIEAA